MPSISVVIPTYNRAHFIAEAIGSILAQSVPVHEIIVVDDGSKDNTQDVLARFGNRVTYVQQQNRGPAAARNNGFRRASGDFIALLDSDDLWESSRLTRQAEALERFPRLDFIFGREAKFSHENDLALAEIQEADVRSELETADIVLPDPVGLLLRENCVPTSTVMFRRSCLEKVGFIDESRHHAEDYDFWLRFALAGYNFAFINAALCRRRMHEGNLVNQWVTRRASSVEVLSRYRSVPNVHRERLVRRLEDLCYDLGSHLLRHGDFGRAQIYLRQARKSGVSAVVLWLKLSCARLLNFGKPERRSD